jgi:hypothetical protein
MFYIECDECGTELRGFGSPPPVPHLCGKCFGSIEYQCADEILEAFEQYYEVTNTGEDQQCLRDQIAMIVQKVCGLK